MGLTQIQSNASSFIQPSIGGIVTIIIDPGIDWIKVNSRVHIHNGGIYKVISLVGFVAEIELETATTLPGQTVLAELMQPINNSDSTATFWGGENGKEW